MEQQDRHLKRRGGRWYYIRRVPVDLEAHYPVATIKRALKTADLAEARLRRNAHEEADNAYWCELRNSGDASSIARRRYDTALKRANALRYEYKPLSDLASKADLSEILARVEELTSMKNPTRADADALLGRAHEPSVSLMDAFKVVCAEVKAEYLSTKDNEGRQNWINAKLRPLELFVRLYGDRPIEEINRDLARKFFNHLKDRVAGINGEPLAGNSANRYMGAVKTTLAYYRQHVGDSTPDPFGGLSFSNKQKTKRLSLRIDQIDALFLRPGAFQRANRDIRLIVYIMIETGARLAEIATLERDDFELDGPVPHIVIQEKDGRSLKTENSNRVLPVLGIALEAAKLAKNLDGFSRYRARRNGLSTAINKFCRGHEFFEAGQSIYSLRHSFEDRLKEARIDVEMRKYLMGHGIGREEYGGFGSMGLKQDAIKQIVRPYDPSVLADIS